MLMGFCFYAGSLAGDSVMKESVTLHSFVGLFAGRNKGRSMILEDQHGRNIFHPSRKRVLSDLSL